VAQSRQQARTRRWEPCVHHGIALPGTETLSRIVVPEPCSRKHWSSRLLVRFARRPLPTEKNPPQALDRANHGRISCWNGFEHKTWGSHERIRRVQVTVFELQ
jgi:hypothetical protein